MIRDAWFHQKNTVPTPGRPKKCFGVRSLWVWGLGVRDYVSYRALVVKAPLCEASVGVPYWEAEEGSKDGYQRFGIFFFSCSLRALMKPKATVLPQPLGPTGP